MDPADLLELLSQEKEWANKTQKVANRVRELEREYWEREAEKAAPLKLRNDEETLAKTEEWRRFQEEVVARKRAQYASSEQSWDWVRELGSLPRLYMQLARGEVLPAASPQEWLSSLTTMETVLARTTINQYSVITIFTGIDMLPTAGVNPLLWETAIMQGRNWSTVGRYRSQKDALVDHGKIVQNLKQQLEAAGITIEEERVEAVGEATPKIPITRRIALDDK